VKVISIIIQPKAMATGINNSRKLKLMPNTVSSGIANWKIQPLNKKSI
jgi:hypothetical protein